MEGAAVFLVALGIYSVYGASWWLLAFLFLLPDVTILAYVIGPRTGAFVYNIAHTYVTPLVVGGAAFGFRASLAGSIALIWVAHIGFDRMLGLGLKYPTRFSDTHLGSAPTPGSSSSSDEEEDASLEKDARSPKEEA